MSFFIDQGRTSIIMYIVYRMFANVSTPIGKKQRGFSKIFLEFCAQRGGYQIAVAGSGYCQNDTNCSGFDFWSIKHTVKHRIYEKRTKYHSVYVFFFRILNIF